MDMEYRLGKDAWVTKSCSVKLISPPRSQHNSIQVTETSTGSQVSDIRMLTQD